MNAYRRAIIAVLAIMCISILPSAAHAAKQRVPPGSYLEDPVSNISELCTQIQNNPKVSARFAKHFGLSSQQITAYLNENVKMIRLSKAGRYTEYFIDVRGRMASHVKLVPAGTPVLVLADGTPIMDMRCGNPMFKSLPKPIVKAQPVVKTKVAQVVEETPPPPVVVVPPVLVQSSPPLAPMEKVLSSPPQEFVFSPVTGLLALVPLLGGGAVTGHSPTPHNVIPELPAGILGILGSVLVITPVLLRRRR